MKAHLAQVGLLVCVLIGLAASSWTGIAAKEATAELNAQRQHEKYNRAANVESWCEGINQIRDYSRLSVRRKEAAQKKLAEFLKGLLPAKDKDSATLVADYLDTTQPYTLPDLPCEAIIAATLSSKRTHISDSHPTVERLLAEEAR